MIVGTNKAFKPLPSLTNTYKFRTEKVAAFITRLAA